MKMEPIQCSETSAYKIQTPGNYPEDNILLLCRGFLCFLSLSIVSYSDSESTFFCKLRTSFMYLILTKASRLTMGLIYPPTQRKPIFFPRG
jgi:hypothetical protein